MSRWVRDGQQLRVQLQQTQLRTQKYHTETALPSIGDTLRAWSQTPTLCRQIVVKKEQREVAIPADPILSNVQQQVPPTLPSLQRTGGIQQYLRDQDAKKSELLDSLTTYVDKLIIAAYDDAQTDRSTVQAYLSQTEADYTRTLVDTFLHPQELYRQLVTTIESLEQEYGKVGTKVQQRQRDLKSAIRQEISQIGRQLDGLNFTETQIHDTLLPLVENANRQLATLDKTATAFLQATYERVRSTAEDFIGATRRVLIARRRTTAERLCGDFKKFVEEQNEFPDVLVKQLNNCNCAHQNMASCMNDCLTTISGGDRAVAFKVAEVFLRSRSDSLLQLRIFEKAVKKVECDIQSAFFRTQEALQAIGMHDETREQIDRIVSSWKQRWKARCDKIRAISARLVHSNSFYVVGVILLIQRVEQFRLYSIDVDTQLCDYYGKVVTAIEARFQRDQRQYQDAIAKVDESFKNISTARNAGYMATITEKLIESMEQSIKTRQRLMMEFVDGADGAFGAVLKDGVILQLLTICDELCLQKEQVNWNSERSQGLIDSGGKRLSISRLNNIINERGKDEDDADVEIVEQIDQSRQTDGVIAPTKQAAPKQAVPQVGKKGQKVTYTMNEDGLYKQLPNFQADINLDEYYNKASFSFNDDGILLSEFKEAICQLLADDPKQQKKAPQAKKGQEAKVCTATQGCEQGTQELDVGNEEEHLVVHLRIPKDYRIMFYFIVFSFMQQEGRRMAYNKAVGDFRQMIENWKQEYLQILNEVNKQQYDEKVAEYAKLMKEYEKKAKTAKKDQQEHEHPAEPDQPEQLVQLPDDVLSKIDDVEIPQEKQRDDSNVYLNIVYHILPYEQLKKLPSFVDSYEMKMAEIAGIKDEAEAVETVKPSSKGKNAQRTDPKKVKEPVQGEENQADGKVVWTDSRMVKHGQAQMLKDIFQNIFAVEVQKLMTKYHTTNKFYMQQGGRIRRQVAIDLANYGILLQQHRQQYVQQAVLYVQTKCAQRNAITQRNVDSLFRRVDDIERKYILDDSRFCQFSAINKQYEYTEPDEEQQDQLVKDGKGAKQSKPPKRDEKQSNTQAQMLVQLQKSNIQAFVEIKYSEKLRQVRQVLLTDAFPQTHPVFRLYPDLYEKYFVQSVVRGIEMPHQLHRELVYSMNQYLHQINKKFAQDYQTTIINALNGMRREVEKMHTQSQKWGQDKVNYDFTFADKAIANLNSQYDVAQTIVPQDNFEIETRHPSVSIYESKLKQLELFKEDIMSQYANDVNQFRRLVGQLCEAIKAGNGSMIKENDERIVIQRESSRLQTLIGGRLAAIDAQLDELERGISACKGLFAKKPVSGDQDSIKTRTIVREPLNKKQPERVQYVYAREEEQLQKVVRFVESALILENIYYLLSYDRDLDSVWKRTPAEYTLAKEQYIQRYRAFNQHYAVLLGLVFALEYVSDRKNAQDGEQHIVSLIQRLSQYNDVKNVKQYQLKNKIYIDQSQIDIATQFKEEVQQIYGRFGSIQPDFSKELKEQECKTGDDWFNYYIQKMGTHLNDQLLAVRGKVQGLIAQRDSVARQFLADFSQYIVDFTQEEIHRNITRECKQLDVDKSEFLRLFNLRFDKLRPVLTQMKDKCRSIQEDAQKLYVDQSSQFRQAFAENMQINCQLLNLLTSCQFLPSLLFSLYPSVQNSCTCSTQFLAVASQLLALINEDKGKQAGRQSPTEKKDTKGKPKQGEDECGDSKTLPLRLFDDGTMDRFSQGGVDEGSFDRCLHGFLRLLNWAVENGTAILGNYNEMSTPQQKGGEKAKQEQLFQGAILAQKLPLEQQMDSADGLPDDRQAQLGIRPPSRKAGGDKKKQDAAQDMGQLPTAPLYELVQISVVALDEGVLAQLQDIGPCGFGTAQSMISTKDRRSIRLCTETANRMLRFYMQNLSLVCGYKEQCGTVLGIFHTVSEDFRQAVSRLQASE